MKHDGYPISRRSLLSGTALLAAAPLRGPHPKNLSEEFFDGTVENCRKIVDAVKPRVAKFSIEMKAWDPI